MRTSSPERQQARGNYGGFSCTFFTLKTKTMSKETAVEWLVDELQKLGYLHNENFGNSPTVKNVIEQAKKLEKENLSRVFYQGVYTGKQEAEW